MTLSENATLATGEQIIEKLEPDLVAALAALHGAPVGVAELAFETFSSGTKSTLQAYGLMQESPGEGVALTDKGRAAIAAASQQIPEPYEDVSLDELSASTRATLENLIDAGSGARVREPEMRSATMGQPASRIRQMGGSAAAKLAALTQRLGKDDEPDDRGTSAGA